MQRQFTATVYLFYRDLTLLHFHEKLKKWLPPGGHLELNETPSEAARREVWEETGLAISFLEEESLRIDAPNAKSLERPFLCLLEEIPAYKEHPAHQHIDFIYLAKPEPFQEALAPFRWIRLEESESLDLFPDVRQVLAHYQRRCCLS